MEIIKSSFMSAYVAKSDDVSSTVSDLAVAENTLLQHWQVQSVSEYNDT